MFHLFGFWGRSFAHGVLRGRAIVVGDSGVVDNKADDNASGHGGQNQGQGHRFPEMNKVKLDMQKNVLGFKYLKK